ncbi:hypothetical protein SCOR_26345 [Sulfidibacter corallicola]|uniref:Prepilin-type N-terminal cleavage/methylation domain-containing protein n=1 Tax=Sulfidibacter corallicola TaxID=2818388 RepID=A0A8A4TRD6_SULCO|nr:hypothetical protein [Sulfidibacter corallicola]QTD52083.1 hypothetical protein J3U87_06380 [Sulfidibacter corallicola]
MSYKSEELIQPKLIEDEACGTHVSRGLSLIEAMVSLIILIVGIGGLAAAFQHNIFQAVTARNHAQAAMIVETVVNELTATSFGEWDLAALEDEFQFTYQGHRMGTPEAGSDPVYYTVTLDETATGLGWSQLSVGVTWSGWVTEAEKSGINSTNVFAYEANVLLSAQYDVLSGGASP